MYQFQCGFNSIRYNLKARRRHTTHIGSSFNSIRYNLKMGVGKGRPISKGFNSIRYNLKLEMMKEKDAYPSVSIP